MITDRGKLTSEPHWFELLNAKPPLVIVSCSYVSACRYARELELTVNNPYWLYINQHNVYKLQGIKRGTLVWTMVNDFPSRFMEIDDFLKNREVKFVDSDHILRLVH